MTSIVPAPHAGESTPDAAESPYRRAAEWNLLYPDGTEVIVQAPAGNWCPTTTRFTATVNRKTLQPVVCVNDFPGEFPLDMVRAIGRPQLGGAA